MVSPDNIPAPNFLSRSISHKEPPSFSDASCTPSRLSTAQNSRLYVSQPSSPARISFAGISPTKQADQHPDLHTIYRCVSSVLKKDGQILSIAASNGLAYTGSQSNVIRIWKLPDFTECGQLKSKACMVMAIHVSNDKVYAAYADSKIRVWQRSWEGTIKHVRLATIPKSGGYVRSYITGKDKSMKHAGPITSLAINVSDDILYSASVDTTVKVWRISDLKCIETIHAHQQPINAIALADNGGVLYTASDDATVKVWRRNFCSAADDRPHSLTVTLPAKSSPVKALTLASSDMLYGGCTDGYVHYWLKGWFSGQLQYGGALQGHTHAVMWLSSVADYVISGSADSSCRVWVRAEDGSHRCVAVLMGHRGPIRCVAAFVGWSAAAEEVEDGGGCTICTGSLDGVLKVWRVKCTECMKGSFPKARVLYAPIEEIGGEERLSRACQIIIDAFVDAGLVLERDAKHKLKFHATVMNVRHRKSCRNHRKRYNDSFDARTIADQYVSEDWGEYLIRQAHISERFAFDEKGYYHCCASIPFPIPFNESL